jgi:hypothetical protein
MNLTNELLEKYQIEILLGIVTLILIFIILFLYSKKKTNDRVIKIEIEKGFLISESNNVDQHLKITNDGEFIFKLYPEHIELVKMFDLDISEYKNIEYKVYKPALDECFDSIKKSSEIEIEHIKTIILNVIKQIEYNFKILPVCVERVYNQLPDKIR